MNPLLFLKSLKAMICTYIKAFFCVGLPGPLAHITEDLK